VSAALAEALAVRGIRDERVLDAMARVLRADFVPPSLVEDADLDAPLPIGYGQTISQPWVVGYMLQRLALTGGERVLEVGTGSGYQAALLALLAREVHSVEVLPELSSRAAAALARALPPALTAGIHLHVGDGTLGWPDAAPFDAIVVAAAGPDVPPALTAQLAPGGRLLLPVGPEPWEQVLRLVERRPAGIVEQDLLPVRFVPLTHGGAGPGVDSGR
jgi:protein-L-isoaspartate(D-aspartate) O-methyltransferase